MFRKTILTLSIGMLVSISASALTVTDGFEGPWDFPGFSFDFNTDGVGFDADWFVDNVAWVGDNQFQMTNDGENKTEGEWSQKINSAVNDGNIRDLYLARLVEGVEPGVEYTISIDYRYDQSDQGGQANHIMVDVRDGDHQTRDAVGDIEDYSGHSRPDTERVDPSTFDSGEFHTFTTTHTPAAGETSFTFLMIVRFQSPDLEANWVWLDNFIVTGETTDVGDWSVY